MRKLSKSQRDVLAAMAAGDDLMLGPSVGLCLWNEKDGYRKVHWNTYAALANRDYIGSYKLSSVGSHYQLKPAGWQALKEQR